MSCNGETCVVGDGMERLLRCAMDIGEQMLLSGAEVHRVEESVKHMCRAFGAVRTDVFIIPSSMVVSVCTKDDCTFTQTKRITGAGVDYEKLHRLNRLSRRICRIQLTEREIREELEAVARSQAYPFPLECACYAVIAGAFTLFFGGTLRESLVSLLIGTLVRLGTCLTDKAISGKIFSRFFSSAFASALAFVAVALGWIAGVDKVIIGNIMTLIPGLGLTNALRDLFTGDSIAGIWRATEAVLVALAIAAGYFLIVVIGGLAV